MSMKLTFDTYEYDINTLNYRVDHDDENPSQLQKNIDCEFTNAVNINQMGDIMLTDFGGSFEITYGNDTIFNGVDYEFSSLNVILDAYDRPAYSITFLKNVVSNS